MAKVKVTLKFNGSLKAFEEGAVIPRGTQNSVGQAVINEMKRFIAIGLSPVKGVGRFVGYKATRASQEVKKSMVSRKTSHGLVRAEVKRVLNQSNFYPNTVKRKYPGKNTRPVNLLLSGDFLDTLDYEVNAKGVEIGHIQASSHTKNLIEAHNEGKNKNVPQRKYLPTGRGEEFADSIMALVKQIYVDRIRQLIKGK